MIKNAPIFMAIYQAKDPRNPITQCTHNHASTGVGLRLIAMSTRLSGIITPRVNV